MRRAIVTALLAGVALLGLSALAGCADSESVTTASTRTSASLPQ
jgi:hypothetical protein